MHLIIYIFYWIEHWLITQYSDYNVSKYCKFVISQIQLKKKWSLPAQCINDAHSDSVGVKFSLIIFIASVVTILLMKKDKWSYKIHHYLKAGMFWHFVIKWIDIVCNLQVTLVITEITSAVTDEPNAILDIWTILNWGYCVKHKIVFKLNLETI